MRIPFGFGAGRNYSHNIAKHLGVEKSLFHSALLEVGVTWKHLELMAEEKLPISEGASMLAPSFLEGLEIVDKKFGPQALIDEARRNTENFRNRKPKADILAVDEEENISPWLVEMRKRNPINDSRRYEDKSNSSKIDAKQLDGNSRYLLRHYYIDNIQQFRGKPVKERYVFEYKSDSLKDLTNKAIVFELGGDKADILDTSSGVLVYPPLEIG